MGRYATEGGGGDFEEAPAGNHLGRCYRLIDLGTQPAGEYKGQPTGPRSKLFIGFELPEALMENGKPYACGAIWTNSLNEKSTMRIVLEMWRSRQFTNEELGGFDLNKILNVPGIVTLGKKPQGTRVTVLGVGPLMRGMTCPPLVNEAFSFWIDEWDQAKYESLSDGLKKMIMQSKEYKERFSSRRMAQDDTPPRTEDFSDDIPFN